MWQTDACTDGRTDRRTTDRLRYDTYVPVFIKKQEISLKKIFGGSQILTIITQQNDEIPLHPLVFACSNLKPTNVEVVVLFLVSLLLGALFAELYASESFQILGTSPAKVREQFY